MLRYFKIIICSAICVFVSTIQGQDSLGLVITPPDGLYNTWKALASGAPMNRMDVEKVPFNKKYKKNKDYSFCKLRYKLNEQLIIGAYAIVIDGDIYLNSAEVNAGQHEEEKRYKLSTTEVYFKVEMQGRFWFINGMINNKTKYAGLGGLVLAGPIGGFVGTAINEVGPAGPIGIIYDPALQSYSSIRKCDELRAFSIQHHSGMQYPCKGQKFTHHQVRQFVFRVNNGQFPKQ